MANSVGRVGDFYDNALAETMFGLNKTELIEHCGPWRDRRHVEWATLEWVDWFNNRRLLKPIGYLFHLQNLNPCTINKKHRTRSSDSTKTLFEKPGAVQLDNFVGPTLHENVSGLTGATPVER